MKPLCYIKGLILFLISSSSLFASPDSPSAVVFYGGDIPYTSIEIHDYIILQPGHVNTASHWFRIYSENIYAYISIGEIAKAQPYYQMIDTKWTIGENTIWNTYVMNISSKAYHTFLLEKVIDPLVNKGFKNFFFDTLDSYRIIVKSSKDEEKMRQGLIQFIHTFKQRYPNAKLIINRGFEIIDQVHKEIDAVLFESLFYGLSSKDLSYCKVSHSDRKWLLTQIDKIKTYNKPIITLEYIPENKTKLIKKTIKSIEALGLIPYVADQYLLHLGKSSKTAAKCNVVLHYDDVNQTQKDVNVTIYSQ